MSSPPNKKARIANESQEGAVRETALNSPNAPFMAEKATQTPRTCVNCSKIFDPSENPRGSCIRHPGEHSLAHHTRATSTPLAFETIALKGTLEVDQDDELWADHYEGDGEITVERFFDDFPENFIWNCCDKRGTEPKCENDIHLAKVEKIM